MLRNLGCLAHPYTHYYIISIILSFMLPIDGRSSNCNDTSGVNEGEPLLERLCPLEVCLWQQRVFHARATTGFANNGARDRSHIRRVHKECNTCSTLLLLHRTSSVCLWRANTDFRILYCTKWVHRVLHWDCLIAYSVRRASSHGSSTSRSCRTTNENNPEIRSLLVRRQGLQLGYSAHRARLALPSRLIDTGSIR